MPINTAIVVAESAVTMDVANDVSSADASADDAVDEAADKIEMPWHQGLGINMVMIRCVSLGS